VSGVGSSTRRPRTTSRAKEVNILRNRKLTALLKDRGRITFNWGGTSMVWRVRYRRAPMQGYADTETLTFPRRDRWKTAELEWRGYAMTDSMTKGEKLQEQERPGHHQRLRPDRQEPDRRHAGELLRGAVHRRRRRRQLEAHPRPRFFSGTSGASAGNFIAKPSTATPRSHRPGQLRRQPGRAPGPSGKGDAHYDFWSPDPHRHTEHRLALADEDVAGDVHRGDALRHHVLQKNKTNKGSLDVIFFNTELYRQFLEQARRSRAHHHPAQQPATARSSSSASRTSPTSTGST
jgi:hypothetical protein